MTFPSTRFALVTLCYLLSIHVCFSAESLDPAALKKELRRLRNEGDDALMKKDYSAAIKAYGRVIALEPDSAKNYYKRVRAFEKSGKLKQALGDLSKALAIDPAYTSALNLRGRIQFNLGRCAGAIESYKEVLRLKPTHGDAKKMLPKAMECQRMMEHIEAQMKRGEWEDVERLLDEAIDFVGKAPDLLFLRARARYELEKFYESIADAGAILKIEKDNVDALLLRARGYYRVAEHDMAQRHIREIMRFDPEHEETKQFSRTLKELLKLSNDADKAFSKHNHESLLQAVSLYEQAIETDRSHLEFNKHNYLKLCKCYAKLQEKEKARVACETATNIDESLVEGYTIYAEMLSKAATDTPGYEEALRAWQQAMDAQGNNPRIQDGYRRAEVALKQSKTKNYYKILGVPRDANGGQIKKAYRKKAKELHPDMHADKTEDEQKAMEVQFQEVAEAYEVLSSDELRGKYDRGEDVFENQGNNRQRHGGFPFHFRRGHGGGQQFHFNF